MKKTLFLLIAIVAISACGSKARVMRMENGINRAEHVDVDKEKTKAKVTEAANDFCEDEKKKAVVVKEDTTFSGTLDEKSTGVLRTAGVVTGVLGQREASRATKGATLDSKYTTVLTFKCE